MSIILDALKRAEGLRKKNQPPTLMSGGAPAPRRNTRVIVLAAAFGLVAATIKIRDNIDKFMSDLHRQGTWASWAAVCAALAILLQATHYLAAR